MYGILQPGLSPVTIKLSAKSRQKGSSYKQLHLLPRRITQKDKKFGLPCFCFGLFVIFVWFCFVFNQVALPQTSTTRAGFEFLLTVSFFHP